jgi:hypothetical protein
VSPPAFVTLWCASGVAAMAVSLLRSGGTIGSEEANSAARADPLAAALTFLVMACVFGPVAVALELIAIAARVAAWARRRWRWESDYVIGLPRLVRRDAWECGVCGANDFEDHKPGCSNDPGAADDGED